MTALFLSPEEVETLTGRIQQRAQERWLRGHGITCMRNARNEVVVHRSAVDQAFGVKPANQTKQHLEVDFSNLERHMKGAA